MQIVSPEAKRILIANKWRYASLTAGFVLFLAPFAFFTRSLYGVIGNQAAATLHSVCFRMPLDWLFGGRFTALWGSVAAAFVLGVIVLSFFAGPVFCGWLCPVGAVSEGLSRAVPLSNRFRLKIRDSGIASAMRWGFLAGFVCVSVLVGYRIAAGSLGSICCRFCTASLLQNFSSALFADSDALGYWHSGSILVLGGWLGVGGLFLVGGRGWCLVFCPLGALSNLAHRLGARWGWLATNFNQAKCNECADCRVTCPMYAIKPDRSVEKNLCINCYECTHACLNDAYRCAASNGGGIGARLLRLTSGPGADRNGSGGSTAVTAQQPGASAEPVATPSL